MNFQIFLLVSVLLTVLGHTVPPTVISPVAIAPLLPSGIIYESTSKIMFKLQIPDRKLPDLLVTNLNTCSSFSANVGAYCPLQFYLQDAAGKLLQYVTSTNFDMPSSPQQIGLDHDVLCNFITLHFPSLKTSPDALTSYLSLLNDCNSPILISTVTFPVDDVGTNYGQAILQYTQEYFTPPNDQIDNAAYAAANAALIASGLTHFLAERAAWSDGINSCSSGHMPLTLISSLVLQEELEKLYVKMVGSSFEAVIPLTDVAQYRSLPLADCTISADSNELFVLLLVPVISTDTDWQLVSLRSIPFRHNFNGSNYICSVEEFQTGRKVVYERSSYSTQKSIFEPHCEAHGSRTFCRVPINKGRNEGMKKWKSSCEEAILGDIESEIIQNCPLSCEPERSFSLPIIQPGNGGEYYITGDPLTSVIIRCHGTSDNYVFLPEAGALRVRLSCVCSLLLSTRELLPDLTNCPGQLDVTEVIPINLQKIVK